MDRIAREFLVPFWKIHVLHHAATRDVHGLWMLHELAEHGYAISPGTLYPLLARMQRAGWLTSRPAPTAKGRRSYRITAEGRRVLRELQRAIRELHDEVVVASRHGAPRRSR